MTLLRPTLVGGPFDVTQGDAVEFYLQAVDGAGNPVNLTGASFVTQIKGPNGVIDSFDNSHHAITDAVNGLFTLTLSATETQSLGLGANKAIITEVTIGGNPTYYRGENLLTVYSEEPQQ